MTTKEWLMRAWKIDREINALIDVQKAAYDRLTGAMTANDNTPVSGTKDPHKFDSYVELTNKIDRRIYDLCAVKAEIIDMISLVGNNTQRALLINRYVLFKTWDQIAVDMNYSYQGVMKLHRIAFQSIKELLTKDAEKSV